MSLSPTCIRLKAENKIFVIPSQPASFPRPGSSSPLTLNRRQFAALLAFPATRLRFSFPAFRENSWRKCGKKGEWGGKGISPENGNATDVARNPPEINAPRRDLFLGRENAGSRGISFWQSRRIRRLRIQKVFFVSLVSPFRLSAETVALRYAQKVRLFSPFFCSKGSKGGERELGKKKTLTKFQKCGSEKKKNLRQQQLQ